MRIVMLSKALVTGAYQRKCELIAAHAGADIELTVLTPPAWGAQPLERVYTRGYTLRDIHVRFGNNFHLHHYPDFRDELETLQPDLVHLDEEPYNYATYHALRQCQSLRKRPRVLFFSWQNIRKTYPPPFVWFESAVLSGVDAGIAGSHETGQLWRDKGFKKPLHVIPQFGVDEQMFTPGRRRRGDNLVVGFAGRLVDEKGVDTLLHALAPFDNTRALIAGEGPAAEGLRDLAMTLGIDWRVKFLPPIPSVEMPEFYRSLDALVLPSRTAPNWKEQFGRVLTEAMACGVPVIGSASGEIPNVIGEAGLLFPENDASMLSGHIQMLNQHDEVRQQLGALGRARALERFTMAHIASRTVEAYRTTLAAGS
jgi:glycosyltransferase involved in cell wall biosynthesis